MAIFLNFNFFILVLFLISIPNLGFEFRQTMKKLQEDTDVLNNPYMILSQMSWIDWNY